MNVEHIKQRALVSWASVAVLAAICLVLAVLQYRWIGEVSVAEKERLHDSVNESLRRLSRDFNTEIQTIYGLQPTREQVNQLGREEAYASKYMQWRETAAHVPVISQAGVAIPEDGEVKLFLIDSSTGRLRASEWPDSWTPMRERLTAILKRDGRELPSLDQTALVEIPRFASDPVEGRGPRWATGPPPGSPREFEWLVAELNLDYVRTTLIPDMLHKHLGVAGKLEYEAEVYVRHQPDHLIFHSAATASNRIAGNGDGSVGLFDSNALAFARRIARDGRKGPRKDKGPFMAGPGPGDFGGRWQLVVRNKSGSLEAIVNRARWRNLAVSAGLLLLIVLTAGTLVQFTRQAQQLVELQMNFVAGVSHELRTPLTVIRTAAFNLRGKLASRPENVERYGRLIGDECVKLSSLVEQVLRFASARAGHVIRERGPASVEAMVDDGFRSSRAVLEGSNLQIERRIDPGLPIVLADEVAMKHAIQNLIDNAVKYGTEGSNWIGLSASKVEDADGEAVEIRVADRGPGIPADEQQRIFDPFFRGKRAVQDQVHGTGLGLNLVRKIVEAHGGTVRVHSEPMKGTEFIVRIPAAPPEMQDEFAHSIG